MKNKILRPYYLGSRSSHGSCYGGVSHQVESTKVSHPDPKFLWSSRLVLQVHRIFFQDRPTHDSATQEGREVCMDTTMQ